MITYRKMREMVVSKKIRWIDVKVATGLSNEIIAKINKDDYVTLRTLERLAEYFDCDIGDLVEIKKSK